MLLDEQVQLEWVLPVLTTRPGSSETWAYVVSEEGSPDDLPFAMLEKRWLARLLAAEEVKQGDIFTPSLTQSHFHLTGHYNGLGKLEDLWFRQEGMDKRTIGHAGSLSIHAGQQVNRRASPSAMARS